MKDRIIGLWVAAAVIMLLAGAISVSAAISDKTTDDRVSDTSTTTGSTDRTLVGDRVTTADRVNTALDCVDHNPYDSIATCEGTTSSATSGRPVSDYTSTGSAIGVDEGEWIMLQCQLVDRTDMTMQCWPLGSNSANRATVSDSTTLNSRTNTAIGTSSMGTSWSDLYDYNNPTRQTVDGTGDRVESDTTRGFESPVVYKDTLNTQRTTDDTTTDRSTN
jgi:hypothetical protein